MDNVNILIAGLRALLFISALIASLVYVQEISDSFALVCAVIKGRVRSSQIISLAALGWFVGALACITMTAHRCFLLLFNGLEAGGARYGTDAWFVAAGLFGLSFSFYAPVIAMLWYRGKLQWALAISFICPVFGLSFALLAQHHLTHYQVH